MRAFLINRINEIYSKNYRCDIDEKYNQNGITILSKLKFCLERGLIPFLHDIEDKSVIITIDIMKELRTIDLENVTSLKDVGELLDFKYVNKNFNGRKMRVLEGSFNSLSSFLESKIR